MKTSLFLTAALVAAILPTAASAQRTSWSRSVTVSYRDLDLGSEAGRHTLQSRINGALRRVCGQAATGSLQEMADHRRCMAEARTAALALAGQAIARANGDRATGLALAGR